MGSPARTCIESVEPGAVDGAGQLVRRRGRERRPGDAQLRDTPGGFAAGVDRHLGEFAVFEEGLGQHDVAQDVGGEQVGHAVLGQRPRRGSPVAAGVHDHHVEWH